MRNAGVRHSVTPAFEAAADQRGIGQGSVGLVAGPAGRHLGEAPGRRRAGLLNYRFGLVIVIPAAILIGYLTARLPGPVVLPAALASIPALAAMSGQSFGRHQVVLATEAAQDLSAQQAQIQAGTFLVQHTTGLILLDIVQNERVGFDVVDRTIYDGTREAGTNRWAAVLRNPQVYGIRVIVMRLPNPAEPVDVVYYALHDSPRLRSYRLIYHSPAYLIYGLPARLDPRRG